MYISIEDICRSHIILIKKYWTNKNGMGFYGETHRWDYDGEFTRDTGEISLADRSQPYVGKFAFTTVRWTVTRNVIVL